MLEYRTVLSEYLDIDPEEIPEKIAPLQPQMLPQPTVAQPPQTQQITDEQITD